MRIVFLHLTMGVVLRGSETVTDQIAEELSSKNAVTVISGGKMTNRSYRSIKLPGFTEAESASPQTIIDKYKFRNYLDSQSKAIRRFTENSIPYLKKIDPDIIVAVNGWPQLQVLKKYHKKSKLVVFGHAGIGYHDRDSLKAIPDLFIALSHQADLWAQAHHDINTKIVHIPNPVNLAIYQDALPAKRLFDMPTVLIVAAFSKYKNIDKVIKAVAKTGYALIVVGEGEESKSLKKIANYYIASNRLSFLGVIQPDKLAQIFKSVDLLCFVPESQEAFGRVYLEAMCCKLPIVATKDDIRRDIIGPDGFYVDPDNEDELVEQIIKAKNKGKVDYTHQLRDYLSFKITRKINRAFKSLLTKQKRQLRLAFVHHTLGLTERGSEISTLILAKELAKSEKVLVVGSGRIKSKLFAYKRVPFTGELASHAPSHAVDKILFRLFMDAGSRQIRTFTNQCIPILNNFKPDIIIATNGGPQLKILKKNFTTSKIATFGRAGIGYHDYSALSEKADLFVALSVRAERWAKITSSNDTHVAMIPNPINPLPFKSAKPANLGLTQKAVLTVSALSKYKNVTQVIKAVAKTDYALILIGQGEEEPQIASLLKNFPNQYRWIKHLENEELPAYYQAASVFCFVPSKQEAFGRVYLEAMSAGLPIVASNDSIRRSIIGNNGYYVNPENTEEITKAIGNAITTPRVNYDKQLSHFSVPQIVKKLKKEFYDLV